MPFRSVLELCKELSYLLLSTKIYNLDGTVVNWHVIEITLSARCDTFSHVAKHHRHQMRYKIKSRPVGITSNYS